MREKSSKKLFYIHKVTQEEKEEKAPKIFFLPGKDYAYVPDNRYAVGASALAESEGKELLCIVRHQANVDRGQEEPAGSGPGAAPAVTSASRVHVGFARRACVRWARGQHCNLTLHTLAPSLRRCSSSAPEGAVSDPAAPPRACIFCRQCLWPGRP